MTALSLADFAEQILRAPLWPHQKAAADCDAFIITIAGGRRSGKSQFAQVKALHVAATNRNCRVLVISPAVENTRNFVRDLAELIRGSRLQDSVVDNETQLVRFGNGSEIRCVAATSAQIRGRGRNLRLAIVDEAAFVPGSVWRDLYYTLFDLRGEGSQALLTCSPWGNSEHFFRASFERGLDGDEDYRSFQWSMHDNPTIDKAFIERERQSIAAREAASEIDGLWSDAIGSLFSRELLERQTADIEIPALADLRGPARGVIGIDWAATYDRCAATGIFRLPVAALNPELAVKPRFVALPWVWPQGAPLNDVVDALVNGLRPFRFVSPEINGIGSYPSTELRRRAVEARAKRNGKNKWIWNLTSTTSASKTTAYSLILGLLEQEQLVLPRSPELLRQLAGLRFEQRERGFTHIEAEDSAVHDDVADSLMLATLPYKLPHAHRVVCELSRLAGSSRAPVDARVPEVDCEVVCTGGGLCLPARPTLQSAAGMDFSTYAPEVAAKPEGFTEGRFRVTTTKQGVTNV
jgi:hypothetical protein